ncbi:hypothetical protein ACI1G2_001239 [Vibrio fluvialis]
MSKYYSEAEAPFTYPDEDEVLETRRIKHEKHLDYFYGDFWCTYMDSENECYLEFDKGHLSVEFKKVKITRTEYEQLKQSTISVKQVLIRHE